MASASWNATFGFPSERFAATASLASRLDFTWERFQTGLGTGARFLARMFPPDFERWDVLLKGIGLEHLWPEALALLGFAVGLIALSVLRFHKTVD